MFFNLALEASDARDIQRANLQIILQGFEDYFSQKSIAWLTTPRQYGVGQNVNDEFLKLLELVVRQTIAVALRSSRAADFIEQLMSLDEDHQECLEIIVKECLGSIEDNQDSQSRSTILSIQSIDEVNERHEIPHLSNSPKSSRKSNLMVDNGSFALPSSIEIQDRFMMKSRNERGLTERGREGPLASDRKEEDQTMSYRDRKLNLLRQISSSFSSATGHEDSDNYQQRKHDSLQRQFVRVEEEARELRAKNLRLENELHKLTYELEALKANQRDLDEKSQQVDQRIAEELGKEKIRMQKEIAAHRSQHSYELAEKDKKIIELENEVMLLRRQSAHAVERFHQQLEEAKEQVIQLKKNEGAIDVYKKKLSEMSNLKTELLFSQEHVQKLQLDITTMQKNSDKEFHLEESVQRIRSELERVKAKSEQKDLKL